ncbi:unnamed protein product [Caenorhabditis auriculariae]|uniref:Uncharacterized protein n=1 Tax=Caenorhabditis auriculariae TaxID=2777116 RepID=A0A8S1GUR5_9PELO|nr:unnamed protein product [Caenorhabditis auriculariae]
MNSENAEGIVHQVGTDPSIDHRPMEIAKTNDESAEDLIPEAGKIFCVTPCGFSDDEDQLDSWLLSPDLKRYQNLLHGRPQNLRQKMNKVANKVKSFITKQFNPQPNLNEMRINDRLTSAAYMKTLAPQVSFNFEDYTFERKYSDCVKLWDVSGTATPSSKSDHGYEPSSIIRRLNRTSKDQKYDMVCISNEYLNFNYQLQLLTPAPVDRDSILDRLPPNDPSELSFSEHRRRAKAIIEKRAEEELKNPFSASRFNAKFKEMMLEAIDENEDEETSAFRPTVPTGPMNIRQIFGDGSKDSGKEITSNDVEEADDADDDDVVIYRL